MPRMIRAAIAIALMASTSASAQNIRPEPAIGHRDVVAMSVPVIEGDITDHPYRVVGTVEATAQKLLKFSRNPSETKLAGMLWDKARALNAHAVLNVKYGPVEEGGPTYARRRAKGQAVRFLSAAEAEAWRKSQP